jgi:ATP-binding cassette, subfamily B, bacterial HlyB/CyaB
MERIHILEPTPGQLFWQSTNGAVGLFIILSGRARLLDSQDNLITSLEVGESFGELTLFRDEKFQPYRMRASVDAQMGYLEQGLFQDIFRQSPPAQENLHFQAVLKDLLILYPNLAFLRNCSPDALTKIFQLSEVHALAVGKLPHAFWDEQQLGLIREGEISRITDATLTPGNLCIPGQYGQSDDWDVIRPTEMYCFRKSNWPTVLKSLPEFAEWVESEEATSIEHLISLSPRRKSSAIANAQVPAISQTPSKQSRTYFPSPSVQVGHWWQRITRRYPVIEQQSTSDCGAACLAMISSYWGKRFSLNRLREMTNIDRNGSSLRGLAVAAENIGFASRPVKASLDQLAKQPLPAIAHWQGKHYVIVYEVGQKAVTVVDPAMGQRRISRAAFRAGWTGYALLLQPTTSLKQAEEAHLSAFWQFFELVKPHRLILLEVLLASILVQIFGLLIPLLTQLLLDRVVVQRSTLTLTAVGIGLLIFSLFRVGMTGLRQYLLDYTANKVDLSLVIGFIRHTFQLPLRFFESRYVGDIISRVQENYKIQQFLTGEALSISLDLLTVFVYVGLMFWYSWKMALLALAIVPPFFLIALVATPFFRRMSKEIFNAMAAQNSYLIEALTGIRTIRSMSIEQTVRWRWEELLNTFIKSFFAGQLINNGFQVVSATIEALATVALLWFGAWQVIQNQLTIGQLVAFNMLLVNVIQPFRRLIVLWHQLQEVIIAVERIHDVLEAEPEEDWHSQSREILPSLEGHICFNQVTFRYHPESDVNTLENISFEVQPGQTVAIVGRSGSGKTTISKLILGLYPPTEGKILIDGFDITTVALRSLRQQIGVVDQDTFLFGSTLRENISIGHPEATLAEIRNAAEQAGAEQFICQLPMGYETHIGEGGGMLSGGQRQRLAIARALLGNPRLLIFDEATSHLDAESERIIQSNLNSILRNQTTVLIAHRLSTIRQADLILVLDQGNLVESGTHEQLLAQHGHYFYLNQQQLMTPA